MVYKEIIEDAIKYIDNNEITNENKEDYICDLLDILEKSQKIYALYKGEELLATGTKEEIAKKMNISKKTIQYYSTPAYRKRIMNGKKCRVLVYVGME